MTVAPMGLAAYRFRTTLARRWTGYLTIVVLVGLLGGVACQHVHRAVGACLTQLVQ